MPNTPLMDQRSNVGDRRGHRLGQLMDAVDRQEAARAARLVRELGEQFSSSWLDAIARSLDSGETAATADGWANGAYLNVQNQLVVVGPYTITRKGTKVTKLSAVAGEVLARPDIARMQEILVTMLGPMRQPLSTVLPLRVWDSAGHLRGEDGEAFIVHDGWGWPRNTEGPSLNNVDEQRRRFETAGFRCIRAMFDEQSAALLCEPLLDRDAGIRLQALEYQLHDAGHSSGYGFINKVRAGMLPNYWHNAVEEWRSDGVAFAVAHKMWPAEEVGRLVASNLCTRFGLDSHRAGGLDRDTDVNASMLTFDSLVRAGAVVVRRGKLAFSVPTYEGLADAVRLHCLEALTMTREEVRLNDPGAITSMVSKASVHRASRILFEGTVRQPCEGFYMALQ